ncbi:MAG: radical SAM protein [bacterium]
MEINFIKFITFKRLVNIISIISSFFLSKLLRKPIVWGLPITFSIEPTNRCNLKCPECPSGLGILTRDLGLLSLENFSLIINQIKGHCFYIQLFFQGEPYINKNLSKMVNFARENKVYTAISTNGLLLKNTKISELLDSPPDKLVFSIDGLDEVSYQNYRVGGKFEDAKNSLINLINEKKKRKQKLPYIEMQFIAMKQNEHQIDDVFKFGKEVGVDKVVIKTMQVSSFENGVKFLPQNKKYSRYLLNNGILQIKNKLKNHCFALWRTSVVTWDGDVVPCCFDKDANYPLGNIFNQKFKVIWKDNRYNSFRQRVLNDRKGIDICSNCTEGLKINIFED